MNGRTLTDTLTERLNQHESGIYVTAIVLSVAELAMITGVYHPSLLLLATVPFAVLYACILGVD